MKIEVGQVVKYLNQEYRIATITAVGEEEIVELISVAAPFVFDKEFPLRVPARALG